MLHNVRNKILKNHDNWLKSKNVVQSQKMPKKLTIFSLKIHKSAGIFKKNLKIILNKGTKHNKNYMENLNLKNKNIEGSGSP